MTGLNIGAGHSRIPGFINIDISERADVSLDLGCDPLPFADDSIDTVISIHTLEHIPNYLFALSEIHRVLRHDAVLLLKLPYVTLTESHLVNPYHQHNFSERSFDFFDPERLRGSAAEELNIAFRKVFVDYTYIGYFGLLPAPLRTWARRHLFNVVRQFDSGLVAIKNIDRPVHVGPHRAREMRAQLGELERARIRYEDVEIPHPKQIRRPTVLKRVLSRIQRGTRTRDR